MIKIEYFGIKTRLINEKENLISIFLDNLSQAEDFSLQNGDIIAIASKVVAMTQGRLIDLTGIKPTSRAKKLAKAAKLPPIFVEIVLQEADEVIGVTRGALLTLRQNILQANAGVDQSNAGINKAILLPYESSIYAVKFKEEVEQALQLKNLGVVVVDSCTRPLRRGTTGISLGTAGFPASIDERGQQDLFGMEMKITYRAIADNIASACNLIMGETNESIPFVIVRGLSLVVHNLNAENEADPIIPREDCLFFSNVTTHRL